MKNTIITNQQKIDVIESIFGKGNLTNDGANISVSCPVCKQNSKNSSNNPAQVRYREISERWQLVMAVLTACSILLAINQIFNLGFFVGYVMLDSRYMYLITGVMLCMVFITFPASKKSLGHVPWYDVAIMLMIVIVFSYYAYYAERIVLEA